MDNRCPPVLVWESGTTVPLATMCYFNPRGVHSPERATGLSHSRGVRGVQSWHIPHLLTGLQVEERAIWKGVLFVGHCSGGPAQAALQKPAVEPPTAVS